MRQPILTAGLVTILLPLLAIACPGSPANVANECLAEQLKNAELTLKKQINYMRLGEPVNDPNKAKQANDLLHKSQKSWLIYRNANCEYTGFIEGGVESYKYVRNMQCMVDLTQVRVAELKRLGDSYNH